MTTRTAGWVGVLVLVGSLGCSVQHQDCSNVITATVPPSGARLSFASSCDPLLARFTLTFPAGSIDQSTQIRILPGSDLATTGEVALGPSIQITPAGLSIAQPAMLSLPFEQSLQPLTSGLAIAVHAPNSSMRMPADSLALDLMGGVIVAPIQQLAAYQVVALGNVSVPVDMAHKTGGGGGGWGGGGGGYDGGASCTSLDLSMGDGATMSGDGGSPSGDGGSSSADGATGGACVPSGGTCCHNDSVCCSSYCVYSTNKCK